MISYIIEKKKGKCKIYWRVYSNIYSMRRALERWESGWNKKHIACCCSDSGPVFRIYFNKKHLDLITIVHEFTHALLGVYRYEGRDLKNRRTEECFAEELGILVNSTIEVLRHEKIRVVH